MKAPVKFQQPGHGPGLILDSLPAKVLFKGQLLRQLIVGSNNPSFYVAPSPRPSGGKASVPGNHLPSMFLPRDAPNNKWGQERRPPEGLLEISGVGLWASPNIRTLDEGRDRKLAAAADGGKGHGRDP